VKFRGWDHLYWLVENVPKCRYNLGLSQVADYPIDKEFTLDRREDIGVAGTFEDALSPFLGLPKSNLLPTHGASEANFLAFAALLKQGDEVLVERPGYFPMAEAPAGLGLKVRRFSRAKGFALDPGAVEKALGRKTRMVVVTNPHNPSGVSEFRALVEIAELCARKRVLLLCDEVYRRVDRTNGTLAGRPWVVVTDSLTKSWGLGSLHCGWMVAEPKLVARARRVQEFVIAGVAPTSLTLGAQAIRLADKILGRARSIVEGNRALLQEWSRKTGFKVSDSRAAVAAVSTPGASMGVARRALEEGVVVVPGELFSGRHFVRVSIGAESGIREGLEGLARAMKAG
jgi:hypothetical protein